MFWHPFRDLGLKIVALGLAVLLWITISGQQVQRNVLVQLQFRNMPAALELTGDTPRTVDVRVRGAAGLISQLEPYQVVATVDLTAARPGLRVFPLTTEHISVPLGVQVMSVDPATILLDLEKSATGEVPVKPTVDGQPAAGYDVGEVTWEPRTIAVVGPESRVKERPSAITERISIDGAKSTLVETVNIGVSDPAVRLRQPQTARVTVTIVPGPIVRFSNRPVTVRDSAGRRATTDPAAVSVTIRGARKAVGGIDDQQIVPYVDVARLGSGRYNLEVHVDPQGDYVVVAIQPATVAVRIQ
jgi:YbbR domain-containing protein